ncbi:MAG: AAA family ATPase [Chitinivibrionia bacterium]|nr:AAA family ATPase [Chitinivibrionia bacterium]
MKFPTIEEYEKMSLEEREKAFAAFLKSDIATNQDTQSRYIREIKGVSSDEIAKFTEKENHFECVSVEEINEKIQEYEAYQKQQPKKKTPQIISGLKKYLKFLKQISSEKIEPNEEANLLPKNLILFGPPGTGKTYNTAIYAIAIAENRNIEDVKAEAKEDYAEVKARFNEHKENGQIAFTTFHQSYSYEEFIEGIRPNLSQNSNGNVSYNLHSGVFKNFCDKAKENEEENYVFVIDEINRGNISKIFGELITLIEDTKRLGANEEATAILPYSQENFGIPNNVYILGTMNTADRSIALLDTALRRRFDFVEMLPDTSLLNDVFVKEINIEKMLEKINKRIEALFDREHTIGHAYFLPLKQENTIEKLARIMKNKIIPLLQEYFYDDYEKIRLCLADNQKNEELQFIKRVQIANNLFGNADLELDDSFEINTSAFEKEEAYVKTYENNND